ncbi:Calcium-regulated actin-bundling protein (34 kDa actin-binding protein) [Durusdinium trenchii]|uniref:cyclic pyranopterin monophosphate synthase n=1 Tax=Durusdinium trenchii TaxID=1381693 RepID=A0ABP0JLW7_9DINO
MVDVGGKAVTKRTAHARSVVDLPAEIVRLFSSPRHLDGPKGPVLTTAIIAGVTGAKQTSSLIPFCHPLPLDKISVDIELHGSQLVIDCHVGCVHKTGVEMEALTGASLAALTVYDMCKAISHDMVIRETRLISKKGGKSDVGGGPRNAATIPPEASFVVAVSEGFSRTPFPSGKRARRRCEGASMGARGKWARKESLARIAVRDAQVPASAAQTSNSEREWSSGLGRGSRTCSQTRSVGARGGRGAAERKSREREMELAKRLSMGRSSVKTTKRQPSARQEEYALLSEDQQVYFEDVITRPFAEQAIAFLNAFFDEIGDQADFIFEVAYEVVKMADMHTRGVEYVHLYEEGSNMEFNVALYFYEKLCKTLFDEPAGRAWRAEQFTPSMPTMMTAIERKAQLREIDLNQDGNISFLEYLLAQYADYVNAAEFTRRGLNNVDMNEGSAVLAARAALEDVNERIRAFEEEKRRLEELSKKPGVRGLGAKHQLASLLSSPIAEELQTALIKAEAALRAAVRADKKSKGMESKKSSPNAGSLWWMQKDLDQKKKMYGRRRK